MKTLSTFVRGWKKLCESGYRFCAARGGDIREIRSGGLTNRLRGSLHNRASSSGRPVASTAFAGSLRRSLAVVLLGLLLSGFAASAQAQTPDLEFSTTHLTWNESKGCGQLEYYDLSGNKITGGTAQQRRQRALAVRPTYPNTYMSTPGASMELPASAPGPTYQVKLKSRPSGTVKVTVYDPNDLIWWGNNTHRTLNRVFVGPDRRASNGRNGIGKPTLTFTPSNWNEWQTVKVKVACTDHFPDAVPLEHRMESTSVQDRGKVWVRVNEQTPPVEIVASGLPTAGETITLAEGDTRDFRIRISERMLPNGSSGRVDVHLFTEPVGNVLRATRRDGQPRVDGVLMDTMVFTPSSREQWVRLEAVGAGDTRLVVSAERDFTWAHETRRHWSPEWPVKVTAPQNAPAQAAPAPAPTEAVSNLQVTVVDAASAGVTWDAVEHATSYEVSWDANGSQTAVSGAESVTGASATIRHDAQEDMTLTVTVTPEYVDGNGVTQRLDALAATATLAVGPGGDALSASAQAEAACVSGALLADARKAASETWRTSGHVERWSRVLAAFGESNAYSNNPMTVAEARAQADRGLKRWTPVLEALECLAAAPAEQPEQAEVQPATPALSLSAGSAVDEGGNAAFTVTADPAPQSDLTIAFTVAQSGEYLDAPGAGSRTVVLTAGAASVALSVATVDDAADEADGSVSVTLGTGAGYTVAGGKGSAAVTVRDDDEPVVSIVAGGGVTEGAPAGFTVNAEPAPAAPLDITLTVGQSGAFAASGETGSRTVTVPVTGSVDVEVATVDDAADEPDGSITASVDAGTGYTVAAAPDNAATVAVSDNDAASSGPTISIADASFKENQRTGYFTVTMSEPADRTITILYATRQSTPVSARAGRDYFEWKRAWRARIWIFPGKTTARVPVYIYNDSHDEDPETFEVVLFDADEGVSISDGVAVGTITNDDPMPAAWLARFGRTAAEQALDGIAGRIAASRSAGVQGAIAGQPLAFGPVGTSPAPHAITAGGGRHIALGEGEVFASESYRSGAGAPADSRLLTTRDLLLGSNFTQTGEKDGTGGSFAFWGRAAQSSFDGREGSFSLDGEATTAMLGADYARGDWLVGMALMHSSGEGGYADNGIDSVRCPQPLDAGTRRVLCSGAVREGDGSVEASLAAAVPYASLRVSERLKLWGALGYGSGEVTLETAMGDRYDADTTWSMAAAGLRGGLLKPGGFSLALLADALWTRTDSDETGELSASRSEVNRLRLGIEGSREFTLDGGVVSPRVEFGVRHDGGGAETGFGVEVGAGVSLTAGRLGLVLDVSGRTLLAHEDEDLKDRGISASLTYDPDPGSKRGASFALRRDLGGSAADGLDALFASDPLAKRSGGRSDGWRAEAAWGLPAFGGRFTGSPFLAWGFSAGARDYDVGWRLEPEAAGAPDLSLAVKATRREAADDTTDHGVGVDLTARW